MVVVKILRHTVPYKDITLQELYEIYDKEDVLSDIEMTCICDADARVVKKPVKYYIPEVSITKKKKNK